MARLRVLGAALLCLAFAASAGEMPPEEGVSVTIYNAARVPAGQGRYAPQVIPGMRPQAEGWAVVKLRTKVNLPAGRGEVRLSDVAAALVPPSVFFKSLTDPEHTVVLEQNFLYDLADVPALLRRYVDRPLSALPLKGGGLLAGRLLSSTRHGLLLDVADSPVPIRLATFRELRLPELPAGLVTRPTLVWQVNAQKPGEHLAEVTYIADNITWRADYTLLLNDKQDALDLSGWATVENESGASYPQARLKLMGGDVQRLDEPWSVKERLSMDSPVSELASRFESLKVRFTEKSFFEYHLYTLGRPTTLPDRSRKQIELFAPAANVPCRKVLVYVGGRGERPAAQTYPATQRDLGYPTNAKVDVYLEFKNDEASHVGMPLPAGRVRVCLNDPADGAAEFIGEDEIRHTPKDEKVLVRLGECFDVVGERRQTRFDYRRDLPTLTEAYEIRLRNHKPEAVTVIVQEKFYRWVNWELEAHSHDFEKPDAETARFTVAVPAGGQTVVTYTVRYDW